MKTSKLKKFETKAQPGITPEQHKANCEQVAEMLLTVADKMPNPAPVESSFAELLSELKSGDIKRSPVVVQLHTGEQVRVRNGVMTVISEKTSPAESTKNDLSGAEKLSDGESTKMDSGGVTYSDAELKLLREIENGK